MQITSTPLHREIIVVTPQSSDVQVATSEHVVAEPKKVDIVGAAACRNMFLNGLCYCADLYLFIFKVISLVIQWNII
jgi:hypothetical protein